MRLSFIKTLSVRKITKINFELPTKFRKRPKSCFKEILDVNFQGKLITEFPNFKLFLIFGKILKK